VAAATAAAPLAATAPVKALAAATGDPAAVPFAAAGTNAGVVTGATVASDAAEEPSFGAEALSDELLLLASSLVSWTLAGTGCASSHAGSAVT